MRRALRKRRVFDFVPSYLKVARNEVKKASFAQRSRIVIQEYGDRN